MRRRLLPLALALAGSVCGACSESRRPSPPAADFLVAAGDSTYWVSTEGGRVLVRRSPLFLARVGGRFHELYVADEEEAYRDAVFASQTMYSRDLVTGDSSEILADSAVGAAAAEYAAGHPSERPLSDDEPGDEEPGTDVGAVFELVDVHGPYVSYEYHLDAERLGVRPAHETRRGIVDLRDGARPGLERLFGDTAARRMVAEGKRLFADAVDSVLAARDARARSAVDAIGDFAFDASSFTLTDMRGHAAVQFLAPGAGDAAGGLTLPLAAVRAPRRDWWASVRETLPDASSDTLAERWHRAGYEVVAHYDTASDRVRLAIADSTSREWTVGRFQGPVYHVYWLDRAAADSVQVRALRRAFDEAVLYDESARTARAPGRRLRGAPQVRLASATRPQARPKRRPGARRAPRS
ncbi:MAG: hypothetical protein ACJ8AO_22265 [Gemmatimonadaceae bacterium]